MSPRKSLLIAPLGAVCLALSSASLRAADLGFSTSAIDQITGLKGAAIPAEGVYKLSVPRKDIPITVDGWRMPPFMGLTSWTAFQTGGKAPAMVMGDLVLFEDEVNPVMSALLEHGIAVTAVHNHFFFSQPQVYFMHLDGEGSLTDLADGVKAAFDAEAAIRAARPQPAQGFGYSNLPDQSSISAAPLEQVFGAKGQQNTGMVKFVFGRQVAAACGCTVGKEMGVNTWAAFAGADDNALVDGDFAVHEAELQPVLKSLRADGINIVAIHSHMTGENPRTLFFHYWGRGKAADLAATLKKALALLSK